MSGFGVTFPGWLTHGYRAVTLSADPAVQALLETAPRIGGIPILLNIPAFAIVMLVTWVLLLGVKESARANNIMVVVKLLVLGLFVVVGAIHIDTANYVPFAPNGWTGIHQGAAIVFFAYIGFDAISTAAEETKNPQRNLPIGILGGLAICTLIYVIVGIVATGLVPYMELRAADPLAKALDVAGLKTAGWIVSFGAVISITAVLLVFQVRPAPDLLRDGTRRAASGVGGEGERETARAAHHDVGDRNRGCAWRAGRRRERNLRPHQHRDAVRLCHRLYRRARAQVYGTRQATAIPRPAGLGGQPDRRVRVLLHDAGIAANGLGTVRNLARHRRLIYALLRLQAFALRHNQ